MKIQPVEILQRSDLFGKFETQLLLSTNSVNQDQAWELKKSHDLSQSNMNSDIPQKVSVKSNLAQQVNLNYSNYKFPHSVMAGVRQSQTKSHNSNLGNMRVQYRLQTPGEPTKCLQDINIHHSMKHFSRQSEITSQNLRKSANIKGNDFLLVDLNSAAPQKINMAESLKVWNAKIQPKLQINQQTDQQYKMYTQEPLTQQEIRIKPKTADDYKNRTRYKAKTVLQSSHTQNTQDSSQVRSSLNQANTIFKQNTQEIIPIGAMLNGDQEMASQVQYEAQIQNLLHTIKLQQHELYELKQYIRESLPTSFGSPQFEQSVLNEEAEILPLDQQPGESSKNTKSRDDKANAVHSLYQSVYISDMRSEIQARDSEIARLRQRNIISDQHNMHLQMEIENLKNKLNQYRREVVQQKQSFNQQQSTPVAIDEYSIPPVPAKFHTKVQSVSFYSSNQFESTLPHSQLNFFNSQLTPIRNILQTNTLPELIQETRSAILKIFKANQVDFLLMDKEFSSLYKLQNGKTQRLYHAHFGFEIAVPPEINLKEDVYPFQPTFKSIKDVQIGLHNKGKNCVYPTYTDFLTKKILLLIQIQYSPANKKQFSGGTDIKVLQMLTEIMNEKYKSLNISRKVQDSQLRAVQILNTFKSFLAERSHVSICKRLMEVFPSLFNFQACGVLFMDPITKDLFKIQFLSKEQLDLEKNDQDAKLRNQARQYDNIIYFPLNVGCTGIAIKQNKIVYFNEGENCSDFQNEIDNSMGATDVESLLISPIVDSEGNLRGVVQMANKLNGEKITNQDIIEVGSLMPALGEIFKTAQEVREFQNVSSGIHKRLIEMKGSIIGQIQDIDDNKMANIASSVHILNLLVKDLVGSKKKAILGDRQMTNELFALLRQQKLKEESDQSKIIPQ